MTPRTNYERIAETYDQSEIRHDIPPDADLGARVRESDREIAVLDVGCGTGNWLARQRLAYPHERISWFGVDRSPAMLERARLKNPHAMLSVASADNLTFSEEIFDLVVTSFAFHHFPDKDKALDEMLRVACAGGLFKYVNICPEHMDRSWLYRLFPATQAADRTRFWSTERLFCALDDRGTNPDVMTRVRRVKTPLATIVAEARKRDASELADLPDADFKRCLDDLEARLAREPESTFIDQIALVEITAHKP